MAVRGARSRNRGSVVLLPPVTSSRQRGQHLLPQPLTILPPSKLLPDHHLPQPTPATPAQQKFLQEGAMAVHPAWCHGHSRCLVGTSRVKEGRDGWMVHAHIPTPRDLHGTEAPLFPVSPLLGHLILRLVTSHSSLALHLAIVSSWRPSQTTQPKLH